MRPSDITRYILDRSNALNTLLDRFKERKGIYGLLGELQLAFIVFYMGQSLEGMEQWKAILDTLCRADDAMEGKLGEELQLCYKDFLPVLRFQLNELPQDFFTDDISKENFLTKALPQLTSTLSFCLKGYPVSNFASSMKLNTEKLKKILVDKFKFEQDILECGE